MSSRNKERADGARRSPEKGRTGRRSGQPETRREILDAARALFAERGYAGTSMRAIGSAAGVDPALVHHYFGTKEDLFRAILDVPIDPEDLVRQIVGAGGADTPARLVETFLGVWDSPDTGPQMISFVRRAFADQQSTAMLRDFFAATVLRSAASALLGDIDADEAEKRVALVVSQMLGVAVLRKVVAVEPLASMPVEHLAAALTPTITNYLNGPLPDPRPGIDRPIPTPHEAPVESEGTP